MFYSISKVYETHLPIVGTLADSQTLGDDRVFKNLYTDPIEPVKSDVAKCGMAALTAGCTLIMKRDCATLPDWSDIIQK